MKYDFVFCALCYGNTEDLKKYFQNIRKIGGSYKVIVIDSFFSDEVRSVMKDIAKANDADFIPVENRGYGAGNNAGIKYAVEHYDFNYLVVNNSDIDFLRFDINEIDGMKDYVIGPSITTMTGKRQNPYRPYSLLNIIEFLEYVGFKYNSKFFLYFGIIVNKILRELFVWWYEMLGKKGRTYSVHGSCIIFGGKTLDTLMLDGTIFDENMFMFCEEMELARKARKYDIKMYYVPKLKIRHFEDGSINMAKKFDQLSEERKSYLYCYEKWSSCVNE